MEIKTLQFEAEFEVVAGNAESQAAVMVIPPGDAEGGPGNRHRGAVQWLYVVAGEGKAIVEDRTHELRPGMLLRVDKGERHEIRNSGKAPLRTLNFYVPPAYDSKGEALPAGEG